MRKFSSSHGMGVLLASALLAGLAWAETLEMVTYYPAPAAATQQQDLHVRSLTVGLDYANEAPGDGEALVFDRLGVGTNAPAGPLHVVGVDDAISRVIFMPGTDTAPVGDTDMRVGIGTANPGAELDIYAPNDAVFARLWGASDGDNFSGLELRSEQGAAGAMGDRVWQLAHKEGGGIGAVNDFHLAYFDGVGWFPRVVVDADGRVGIGTDTPGNRLEVKGNTGNTGIYISESSTGVMNQGPLVRFIEAGTTANAEILYSNTDNLFDINAQEAGSQLRFRTSGIEKVRINAAGDVGIATTSPQSRLHLNGSFRIEGNIRMYGGVNSHVEREEAGDLFVGTNVAGNNDVKVIAGSTSRVWVKGSNGRVGIGTSTPNEALHVIGNIYASGTVTSGASDARFKADVRPLTRVLERLEAVRVVSFEWNDLYRQRGFPRDGGRQIGIVAQELERAFPEMVSTQGEGEEAYAVVDYSRLTAVLLAAVQELKTENEALARRVELLEAASRQ